ncbi:hypothetical protein [Streptomyces sp. NPDC047315]
MPDRVRINGTEDAVINIGEITSTNVVAVTLTLYARSITITPDVPT